MSKVFSLFIILVCVNASLLNASESLERGAKLYTQCAGCHGDDGQNKAFNKASIIASMKPEEFIESMNFFRDSKFKTGSSTTAMAKIVKNLANQDIVDLAEYVHSLKK